VKVLLLLLMPWALIGCEDASSSRTDVGLGVVIKTVPHDGHTFILADVNKGGAIMHHPGCECLKAGGAK
jgi:hypothetical protein